MPKKAIKAAVFDYDPRKHKDTHELLFEKGWLARPVDLGVALIMDLFHHVRLLRCAYLSNCKVNLSRRMQSPVSCAKTEYGRPQRRVLSQQPNT